MIQKRYTLNVGVVDKIFIIVAGCGGTGSYAALHLSQLVYTLGIEATLVLVDPDTVEAKNVARQNFCPAEVGMAKAEALARRYSFAYGLRVVPVVGRFEADLLDRFNTYKTWGHRYLTLVVGCVDNAAARRDIQTAMTGKTGDSISVTDMVFWLDAGNDYNHGQVAIGNTLIARPVVDKMGNCVGLPLPSVQEPGLLVDEAVPLAAGSCAELTAAGVQARTINKMMAGWIDVYAEHLLAGKLAMMRTVVDQRSGGAVSDPIVEPVTLRDGAIKAGVVSVRDLQRGFRLAVCPTCGVPLVWGEDEVDGEVVGVQFCPNFCGYRRVQRVEETVAV